MPSCHCVAPGVESPFRANVVATMTSPCWPVGAWGVEFATSLRVSHRAFLYLWYLRTATSLHGSVHPTHALPSQG